MSRTLREIADLDSLAHLAREGGPGLRSVALTAEVDLLSKRPAHMGVPDHSIALILGLLRLASDEEAGRVAEMLAPLSHTPVPIIEALAARAPGPLLARAPWLPASVRLAALDSGDFAQARLLAARPDLREPEIERLLALAEPGSLAVLLCNPNVELSPDQLRLVLRIARSDEELARVAIARSDIDCALLLPLYPHADPAQRQELRRLLAPRVAERGVQIKEAIATPEERALLLETSMSGVAPLVDAVAAVARRGPAFVEAAKRDLTRDVLALALVGLDVPSYEAIRMLLRTGDDIAQDSRLLGIAVDTLRTTPRQAALAILATCWPRPRKAERAGQHQPAMAPGGTPARAAPAGQRRPGIGEAAERLRRTR